MIDDQRERRRKSSSRRQHNYKLPDVEPASRFVHLAASVRVLCEVNLAFPFICPPMNERDVTSRICTDECGQSWKGHDSIGTAHGAARLVFHQGHGGPMSLKEKQTYATYLPTSYFLSTVLPDDR